jgi:hypothetical protein
MKACHGFVLVAAVLAAGAPAAAQHPDWTVLGQRDVYRGPDRHVFDVTDATLYGEIQLCVARQAVRFLRVEIRFRGGDSQNVELNSVLPNDHCMAGINLTGAVREVSQVAVIYHAPGIRRRGVRLRLRGR